MQTFSCLQDPFIYFFLSVFSKQPQSVCVVLKSQLSYLYDHFCDFCLDTLQPVSLPSTTALKTRHSISAQKGGRITSLISQFSTYASCSLASFKITRLLTPLYFVVLCNFKCFLRSCYSYLLHSSGFIKVTVCVISQPSNQIPDKTPVGQKMTLQRLQI